MAHFVYRSDSIACDLTDCTIIHARSDTWLPFPLLSSNSMLQSCCCFQIVHFFSVSIALQLSHLEYN